MVIHIILSYNFFKYSNYNINLKSWYRLLNIDERYFSLILPLRLYKFGTLGDYIWIYNLRYLKSDQEYVKIHKQLIFFYGAIVSGPVLSSSTYTQILNPRVYCVYIRTFHVYDSHIDKWEIFEWSFFFMLSHFM